MIAYIKQSRGGSPQTFVKASLTRNRYCYYQLAIAGCIAALKEDGLPVLEEKFETFLVVV
ncbi:hypothetical protein [Chlorogloeopsis sp. ULAP02]|uniref:hypothetical protein n=1 Tax=Chlorogloeopsis sp. ULAP02 TaxID=3107926 RepID=UPI003134C09B